MSNVFHWTSLLILEVRKQDTHSEFSLNPPRKGFCSVLSAAVSIYGAVGDAWDFQLILIQFQWNWHGCGCFSLMENQTCGFSGACLLSPTPVCKRPGLCAKASINTWHGIGFSVTWFQPGVGVAGESHPDTVYETINIVSCLPTCWVTRSHLDRSDSKKRQQFEYELLKQILWKSSRCWGL